jgi:hypothetical protein
MFDMHQTLLKAAGWLTSFVLLPSCVGTELVAHSSHPGNPNARAGKLPATVGLLSDFDAGGDHPTATGTPHEHHATSHEAGEAKDPHAQDDSEAGAVRYTCPMHPEIVRGEPGTCPKCGMKLVPKAKGPK